MTANIYATIDGLSDRLLWMLAQLPLLVVCLAGGILAAWLLLRRVT